MNPLQHVRLGAIRSIDRSKLVAGRSGFNPDFHAIGKKTVIGLENRTYLVMGKAQYRELDWDTWRQLSGNAIHELELLCLETGGTAYLEWNYDDKVEAYLSKEKHSNDPSVYGARDWQQFLDDDHLDSSLTITVGGITYRYNDDESWAARFEREADNKKQFVRCYEFEHRTDSLTIEVWGKNGEEGVELWTSREINPLSVKIIAQS